MSPFVSDNMALVIHVFKPHLIAIENKFVFYEGHKGCFENEHILLC